MGAVSRRPGTMAVRGASSTLAKPLLLLLAPALAACAEPVTALNRVEKMPGSRADLGNCSLLYIWPSPGMGHIPALMEWYTPGYPDTNYTEDTYCSFGPYSTNWTGKLDVEVYGVDLVLGAGDTIDFYTPYEATSALQLSGTVTAGSTYTITSGLYINGTFISDSADTGAGGVLRLTYGGSQCGSTKIATDKKQSITSPRYPKKNAPPDRYCEYRIETEDPNKIVQVYFKAFKVWSPAWIAFNKNGDAPYSSSDVEMYQGAHAKTYVKSTGNVLRFYWYGPKKSKFKFYIKQVDP